MGPNDKGLIPNQPVNGPSKKVIVFNFETLEKHEVDRQRMEAILNNVGRKTDSFNRIMLMDSKMTSSPYPIEPDTLVLTDAKEAGIVWNEVQKKTPDSAYPPRVPRQFADDFASLANADGEVAFLDMMKKMNEENNYYLRMGDTHSFQYLENALGKVRSAADSLRPEKNVLDEQRKTMLLYLPVNLERVDRTATDRIEQIQNTSSARLKTLNDRLDLTNFGTILRYGVTTLGAAGLTLYKTITDWLVTWPLIGKGSLVAGAVGAVIGGALAFRRYIRKLVDKETKKENEDCDKLREKSDTRQMELIMIHTDHMIKMTKEWTETVQNQRVEVTLMCFGIAMDFFPRYVKEELKNFGADWADKDFAGKNRDEALLIIAEGLHRQMPQKVLARAAKMSKETPVQNGDAA